MTGSFGNDPRRVDSEAEMQRRQDRRAQRDAITSRRRRVGLATSVAILTGLAGLLVFGGDKDKEKLPSGNTIEAVDYDDESVQIGTHSLGINQPGDPTAAEAGQPITVECDDFHRASRTLDPGETLGEFAEEQVGPTDPPTVPTVSIDFGVPLQAVAEGIAAYNGIENSSGEISTGLAQPDVRYDVPESCYVIEG